MGVQPLVMGNLLAGISIRGSGVGSSDDTTARQWAGPLESPSKPNANRVCLRTRQGPSNLSRGFLADLFSSLVGPVWRTIQSASWPSKPTELH